MNTQATVAARQPVLLVVDDSALIRSTIKRALAGLPLELLYAEDGFSGVKMTMQHRPDMILADVMMPRMSGLQFASLIKANILTVSTYFYLLTSKDGEVDKAQGRNSGVDGYIVKPFEPTHLRNLVTSMLLSDQMASTDPTASPLAVANG